MIIQKLNVTIAKTIINNMKLTLWEKFIGLLFIKPLLRKESIASLKKMAKGLPDDKMTRQTKIIQHFCKQILKELNK